MKREMEKKKWTKYYVENILEILQLLVSILLLQRDINKNAHKTAFICYSQMHIFSAF